MNNQSPVGTTNQAENARLEQMMNKGNFQKTEKIQRPVDSIRFGQAIDYATEQQTHFSRPDNVQ